MTLLRPLALLPALLALAALAIPSVTAQPLAPDIVVTKTINAPVADVWKAWTTAEGIESFWAPKAAKVEPVPGVLSSVIRPPMRLTMRSEMLKPRPVPP